MKFEKYLKEQVKLTDDMSELGIYDSVEMKLVEEEKVILDNIEYTDGGHHYVYPDMIPENEIWLSNRLSLNNTIANSLHEWIERTLMKFYGIEYDDAHHEASQLEKNLREWQSDTLPKLKKNFTKGREE